MIKVAVAGALGKMGKEVVKAVTNDTDCELVQAIDKFELGKDIGQIVCGKENGILISDEINVNEKPDIVVDFTQPSTIYENAKNYAQEIISLDMNCSEGYYYLSLAREKMNDIEEAIECMKRAILYDLNNPKYYAKMSEFYKEKEDYKTALDYITEAESLDNSNEYKFAYSELAKLNRKQ